MCQGWPIFFQCFQQFKENYSQGPPGLTVPLLQVLQNSGSMMFMLSFKPLSV